MSITSAAGSGEPVGATDSTGVGGGGVGLTLGATLGARVAVAVGAGVAAAAGVWLAAAGVEGARDAAVVQAATSRIGARTAAGRDR